MIAGKNGINLLFFSGTAICLRTQSKEKKRKFRSKSPGKRRVHVLMASSNTRSLARTHAYTLADCVQTMRDSAYYLTHSFEIVRIISTESNKNNIVTTSPAAITDRCFENIFTLAVLLLLQASASVRKAHAHNHNFHAKQPNRNIKPQHTQTDRTNETESQRVRAC